MGIWRKKVCKVSREEMGIRRNGNPSLGLARWPRMGIWLTQSLRLPIEKTVCSVLEKILRVENKLQYQIAYEPIWNLPPTSTLIFRMFRSEENPTMASFMAKQTPLFPQCELFVFCAWWYASGHEFPGNALYDQFVSFFAINVFTVARLVTIIALKVKFWCVFVATARSSLGDQATAQMLDTQSFVGKSG